MKCELCGATKSLIHHHVSYDPEIIQILCRSCHHKVHWKNGNARVRPSGFRSSLYNDTACYQPCYKDPKKFLEWKQRRERERQKKMMLSIEELETRTRIRAVGKMFPSQPPSMRVALNNPLFMKIRLSWKQKHLKEKTV